MGVRRIAEVMDGQSQEWQKCVRASASMLRRAVAEPPSATACDASPEPTRTGKSGIREV